MDEIWAPVVGYEGLYEVSTHGRVRRLEREYVDAIGRRRLLPLRLFTPPLSKDGYPRVSLRKAGQESTQFVHRLVAKAFIPNPENKPDINHIDGDKQNPRADNLEWCTVSENSLHRCRVLGYYNGQPKRAVLCIETGEAYDSIYSAAVDLGLNAGCILQVCRGIYTHTHGLHFEFIKDEAAEP